MNLSDELIKINQYIGAETDNFDEYYTFLTNKYPDNKTQIDNYIESSLRDLTMEIGEAVDKIGIKIQLAKVSKIVSMSYIAENYFQRTRQWLYKKINGNMVNGKPARFTDNEIKTLNFAIQDISKELGSLSISL